MNVWKIKVLESWKCFDEKSFLCEIWGRVGEAGNESKLSRVEITSKTSSYFSRCHRIDQFLSHCLFSLWLGNIYAYVNKWKCWFWAKVLGLAPALVWFMEVGGERKRGCFRVETPSFFVIILCMTNTCWFPDKYFLSR